MAALVLSARKVIDYPLHVFANTGNDSENPETLVYLEEYTKPFAAKNGIEFVEVAHPRYTLLEKCFDDTTTIPLPIYMESGAPGNRKCTGEWKVDVVARELRRRGATPRKPAVVGIGISMDESMRAKDSLLKRIINDHPLLTLRMTRHACVELIRDTGLPVPPKSSCWFCPFKKRKEWVNMYWNYPQIYWRAVELEDKLNNKRGSLQKDSIYLSGFGISLRELAVRLERGGRQLPILLINGKLYTMADDDDSEEQCMGHCMT